MGNYNITINKIYIPISHSLFQSSLQYIEDVSQANVHGKHTPMQLKLIAAYIGCISMQIVDSMVLNLYFNKTIPCIEICVWLLCTSAFSMPRLLSARSRPRKHFRQAQKYTRVDRTKFLTIVLPRSAQIRCYKSDQPKFWGYMRGISVNM